MKSFIENQATTIKTRFIEPESMVKYLNEKNILGLVNFGNGTFSDTSSEKAPILTVETGSKDSEYFIEAWVSSSKVKTHKIGNCFFGVDGENLFGCTTFPCTKDNRKLDKLTEATYIDLFKCIEELDYPYLFRIWNYIPQINKEEGLEKYKAFCLGRNNAFNKIYEDFGRLLPAATGIGKNTTDTVNIYFLSHKYKKMIHLENPRQMPAYKYQKKYGPKPPSFSRATYVARDENKFDIYVSGTASILGSETVYLGDPVRQCKTTLENIKALLSRDNLMKYDIPFECSLKDMDCIKIYYRRACDLPVIQSYCEEHFAPWSSKKYINVDICRKDLLVEIEGCIQNKELNSSGIQ